MLHLPTCWGCRHMLWEFGMLCQWWLIPPSTCWTLSGGQRGSHTEMIQSWRLAHAQGAEAAGSSELSHQSTGAPNPLAWTWDLCLGMFPGLQDNSGMGCW